VGYTGRLGTRIDRLGIRCAPILASGAMGAAHLNEGSGLGGGGGHQATFECAEGVINDIVIASTVDSRKVVIVTSDCVDAVSEKRLGAVYFGGDGDAIGPTNQQACRAGMAGTGLGIHFGKDVNAVGLICDPLIIPHSAEAPRSLTAPVTVVKQKPVVITGRAKKTQSLSASKTPATPLKPGFKVNNGNHTGGGGAGGNGGGGASAATDTTIYDQPEGNDVAYLSAGDAVTIVSCNGDNWCQISKPRRGWVWAEDLDR
jgi:hypothetical protein